MLDLQHLGKTSLSIELAKKVNGEIISADSMQIYKDMQIGTAKVTEEEMDGINHYLVDFIRPDERYTVSNFKKDSEQAIEQILILILYVLITNLLLYSIMEIIIIQYMILIIKSDSK